jgi:hypothetical protein
VCALTQTLPVGAGVSSPLAVVTYTATAAGVDALTFGTVSVTRTGAPTLRCPGAQCFGATVTKELAPLPTATPLPAAECDIGCSAFALNPPTLNMKVGAAPAVVDVSTLWTNYGAVTAGAPEATCSFASVVGAEAFVSDPPLVTTQVDPTKLAVRVEPVGSSSPPYGDVCLYCTSTQGTKSIGDCLDPTKGALGPYDPPPTAIPSLWTYTVGPCDEKSFIPALPVSFTNNSCRDHLDNTIPANGLCDWSGYSKLCTPATTPDPLCLNVQAVGLIPLARTTLAPDASVTKSRQVNIECLARGTFPLYVFFGSSQATDSTLTAHDPNAANNNCGAVINVTCTKGPEMVKDCDPSTEGIQTACNLWLMNPKFAGGVEAGTDPPITLPPADANGCVLPDKGKGCLAVDVWLKSADDEDDTNDSDLLPECLGAWEHQVRYDHKIIRFVNNLNPATIPTGAGLPMVSWLESTGRIAHCTATVYAEDWILEGCVTTDGPAPGMQVGPCGDGIIEKMLIIPQYTDLVARGIFRPTKDNGVITNIVDDNCEITDIYGEPMADTLPGQLTPVCGDLTITVRMLEGDLDLDCDVDVVDQQAIAFRYGASWGLQLYQPWFDLEPKYADQDIDIKDLQFIFGRNYSTCQAPIPDDQSIPMPPAQPDP